MKSIVLAKHFLSVTTALWKNLLRVKRFTEPLENIEVLEVFLKKVKKEKMVKKVKKVSS